MTYTLHHSHSKWQIQTCGSCPKNSVISLLLQHPQSLAESPKAGIQNSFLHHPLAILTFFFILTFLIPLSPMLSSASWFLYIYHILQVLHFILESPVSMSHLLESFTVLPLSSRGTCTFLLLSLIHGYNCLLCVSELFEGEHRVLILSPSPAQE